MARSKSPPPKLDTKKRRFRRRRVRSVDEPSAMDLIEEAVNLLRRTSLLSWSVYLCGLAPFIVGFLFFWTEMATSGLAKQVLLPASIGMAALFVWFKWTQAYLAKGIRDALVDDEKESWGFRVGFRVLRRQMIWQSTGIFVLPVAFVLTIPFAWVYAFYQNLLISDPLVDEDSESHWQSSWRLARIWTEQNWLLLALFLVVALLTWLNWISLLYFVPYLLKSLLGIETVFSQVGGSLFNSTSLFACWMLTYAVVDPLVKASYLLRHHYCESRRSGADLALRLRRFKALASKVAVLLLLAGCLLALSAPKSLQAQSTPDSATIDSDALDASIDDVLERREFVWRFPREDLAEHESMTWFKEFMRSIEELEERVERWFEKLFNTDEKKSPTRDTRDWDGGGFSGIGTVLSYVLIGILVIIIVLLAIRAWQSYRPLDAIEGSEGPKVDVVPDLHDEDLSADLLPHHRWLELARDFIAKGEYRLALRAYFLAQLSAFSTEGLIVIQRFKSNREYVRDISRRGHGRAGLLDTFCKQVDLFEGVWYGGHPSEEPQIKEMEAYLSEMGVLS